MHIFCVMSCLVCQCGGRKICCDRCIVHLVCICNGSTTLQPVVLLFTFFCCTKIKLQYAAALCSHVVNYKYCSSL